jgi:hypothetical protein
LKYRVCCSVLPLNNRIKRRKRAKKNFKAQIDSGFDTLGRHKPAREPCIKPPSDIAQYGAAVGGT